MKIAIALIALLALSGVALFLKESSTTPSLRAQTGTYQQYQSWKQKFNRNVSGAEDEYRFQVFCENLEIINEHNKKPSKLTLGLTAFADMTNEEYKQKMTSEIPFVPQKGNKEFEYSEQEVLEFYSNPNSIDWVAQGAVTGVKEQGYCNAAWAFSVTASLEGLHYITSNPQTLVDLSEQQVISCTSASNGCNGSTLTIPGFNYTANQGIVSEASYPYTQEFNGSHVTCRSDLSSMPVEFQNLGSDYYSYNFMYVYNLLRFQPLSAVVDASTIYFQLYQGGIIDSSNCFQNQINHVINIVGYDFDSHAWQIKNSWGTQWGNQGFGQIYNAQQADFDGICGINTLITLPTY